jgi:hypothetical protein
VYRNALERPFYLRKIELKLLLGDNTAVQITPERFDLPKHGFGIEGLHAGDDCADIALPPLDQLSFKLVIEASGAVRSNTNCAFLPGATDQTPQTPGPIFCTYIKESISLEVARQFSPTIDSSTSLEMESTKKCLIQLVAAAIYLVDTAQTHLCYRQEEQYLSIKPGLDASARALRTPKRLALLISAGYHDSPKKLDMVLDNSWKDIDTMERVLLGGILFSLQFQRKVERDFAKINDGNLMR